MQCSVTRRAWLTRRASYYREGSLAMLSAMRRGVVWRGITIGFGCDN